MCAEGAGEESGVDEVFSRELEKLTEEET